MVHDAQDTSEPAGSIPLFDPSSSGYPAAQSAGYSYKTVANGMYGYTAMGGYGVVGLGAGSNACGVLARGTSANLSLYWNGAAPGGPDHRLREGRHHRGRHRQLVDLRRRRAPPGTWRKLAGPRRHGPCPITPTHVYNSRAAAPAQGVLGAGGSTALSVKDGRDLTTGNVTVADLIPAGDDGDHRRRHHGG